MLRAVLRTDHSIEIAVRRLLGSGLPALPVVDDRERYAGIFGEREFIERVFPGYLDQLGARLRPRSLDVALDRRRPAARARQRHMNTEHVDVGPDYADTQIAEIFLHHRVLVIPVICDHATVTGLITRRDFFHAAAARFLRSD